MKTPATVPAGTMCSATVHDTYGVGFHKCPNAGKVTRKGIVYCGIHDPGVDTGELAYAVHLDYRGKLKLDSAPIVKRTAATVKLHDPSVAFRYQATLKPDEVDTTPAAAWRRFIAAQEKKVAALEIDVMAAQAILAKAKEQAAEQEQ